MPIKKKLWLSPGGKDKNSAFGGQATPPSKGGIADRVKSMSKGKE